MAEINNESSMTAMLNGKTISLGMFNGKTVFGGSTGVTLSGSVSTQEPNTSPSSRSYSVNGSAGDTGTYSVVFDADDEYTWPSGATVTVLGQGSSNTSTAFSFNAARDQLTITQSYTIPSANETDNWSWTSTDLVQTTYGGDINYTIPDNTSISDQTTSYSTTKDGNVNWTATLEADTNYAFSDDETSKTITGSFTNPNDNSDVTIDLDTAENAVESTLRTLTLSPTNNIASTSYTLSKTEVIGNPGHQEDVNLVITTSDNDRYLTSNPNITGNDYFTVGSGTYSLPIYSDSPDEFNRRITIPLTVTVQAEDTTDAFEIDGTTATVKSVNWAADTQSITHSGSSNFTSLQLFSTDPEGEPPTVSDDASWVTVGTLTYSGGIGTVQLSVDANNSADSRTATITATSSVDDATDTYSLVQQGVPQVPATAATFTEETSKAERYVIDTSASLGESFSFTTVPVLGLVTATTIGAPAGVSISLNNATNTVMVNTPSMATGVMRVLLHPQGNVGTVLDELWLSLQTEV